MKKIVFFTIYAVFFVVSALGAAELQPVSAQTIPPGGTIPPGNPRIILPQSIMKGQTITVTFGIPDGAIGGHFATNGTFVEFPEEKCVQDADSKGLNCTGRSLTVQIETPVRWDRLWVQNRAFFFGSERVYKELDVYLLLLENPQLNEHWTFTPIVKVRHE